ADGVERDVVTRELRVRRDGQAVAVAERPAQETQVGDEVRAADLVDEHVLDADLEALAGDRRERVGTDRGDQRVAELVGRGADGELEGRDAAADGDGVRAGRAVDVDDLREALRPRGGRDRGRGAARVGDEAGRVGGRRRY